MGDAKCYYLLSADPECLEQKLNLTNMDVTSIVNALENKEDPAKILHNTKRTDLVKHSIDYFAETIDSMMLWFDQSFLPTTTVMEKSDINICLKKLSLLQKKIFDMMLIKRRFKQRNAKRLWQHNTKVYACSCRQCNTKITISTDKSDALDLLENHEHIAAALAGNIPYEEYGALDIKRTRLDNTDTEETIMAISSSSSICSITESEASSIKSNNISECNDTTIEKINKVLYPQSLIEQVNQHQSHMNFDFHTIQCCGPNMYHCLLCDAIMQEQSLAQHLPGQRHQFSLRDPFCLKKVKHYHETMWQLPVACQIHQVAFTTDKKIAFLKCKVCMDTIPDSTVLEHVHSRRHRSRLYSGNHAKYHFSNRMKKLDIEHLLEPVPSLVVYNSNRIPETTDVSVQSGSMTNCNDLNTPLSGLLTQEQTLLNTNSTSNSHILISALTKEKPIASSNSGDTSTTIKIPDDSEIEIDKNKSKNDIETPKVVVHNIITAMTENPEDFFDFLENRLQFHKQYLRQEDDHIFCTLCALKLPIVALDIRKHIIGRVHERRANNPTDDLKYVFFCDLCSKYCHEEYIWSEHLAGIEHKQRTDSINKIIPKISPFSEFECTTCRLVLYGNKNSVKFHRIETVSKRIIAKAKEVKLPPHLDQFMKNDNMFYDKVYKMMHESDDVLKSLDLSYKCCKAIQNALKPVFGECRAYPFGSRVSGLGNIESDLDVFVDLGFMFDGLFYQDGNSQSNFVNEATKVLRRHTDFCNIVPIPHARTPIVQVYHRATHMDCDLSFRNGLSVKNTEFLRLSISVQPILKSLILFLKHWSLSCNFNMRISTYALSMLAIFFMQTQSYLPSLKKIRELDPTESKIIGGWRTYSYDRSVAELQTHVTKCPLRVRDLLREFFHYYSTFKYNLEVVCPLMGEPVLKKHFSENDGKDLPPEMRQYVEKIEASADNERFRAMSAMCVQDPFDLSHNLTKAVPVEAVNRFVTLSKLSIASLSEIQV